VTSTLTKGLSDTNKPAPRIRVFETWVHGVNKQAAAEQLHSFFEERRPRQIVTVNLDFLRIARAMPAFNQVINRADLAVPDGAPLVWIARYLGLEGCERVTGPDLIEACATLSARHGYRIFLLGAAPGTADEAAGALEERFPGAQVCGTYSPPEHDYPFPADVDAEIVARVAAARPDALFVAFGCPKQDLWIDAHREELGIPVSIGVGGSFSFLNGSVARAPEAMQRLGLEWTHRLYSEPGRLWRRYLLQDLPFAGRLLLAETARRVRLTRKTTLELEVARIGE
jgi:N-acetylglucosaminyldiphosphoundecaprenol N-acetyl-beta-D-mannosaminyltransferase